MRNNRKGALPDNRQGSPVLSARQHAAAAQPRPPRTVTYPSVEQAQPPQHLGIHIPHRPDASDHPTDAGHCLTSPPGPNAPTPRRNAPVPFKTLPCRRTPTPHRPDTSAPRRHRATPRRRALPRLSAGPQRSNSPSQRSRAIQDTPLPPNTDPTSSRHLGPPPTPGHASPPGTAPPLRRAPTLQLPVATLPLHSRHTPAAAQRPHTVPTLEPPRRRRIQPHRRAQKNPALRAGPIHLSVIFQ